MKKVVVTGIGAITPLGNDSDSFWKNIKAGECGIDFITRFDASDFKVKLSAEVKDFNPSLYMDKGDIRRTDLYVQYAMAASIQAMNDSGIGGKISAERLGVYFSSGIGGMVTFDAESQKLHAFGPLKVSPYFITMMIENMAAGAIALRHGATGATLSIVTACATGTHSIGEAFRAIKHGYADAVIAGGSEAAIGELSIAGFTNCMALTESGDPRCGSIPFDKRRSGFVMGEGAGCLILEEYEHACRRGAKIYAEIAGYGNTNDAFHATAPRADGACAARAVQDALAEAAVKPQDKLYINAHGTGTQLNDKSETAVYKLVLGDRAQETPISSTKSMIGHCLGAAGALEAIVSLKALNEGVLPPTIGYEEPDPACDLNYIPNKAVQKQVDVVLSTNMGFGGHNACVAFKKI